MYYFKCIKFLSCDILTLQVGSYEIVDHEYISQNNEWYTQFKQSTEWFLVLDQQSHH